MKKGLLAGMLAVAALVMVASVGCGGSGSSGDGSQDIISALAIDDGAEKFDQRQYFCPVCGGKPIKGEHYAEVDGKRIYFDKAECAEKFKQNTEEYVRQYRQKMMQSMQPNKSGT